MGVSEWDLIGLCPLDHDWKWANRPPRFGFRTFSDSFGVRRVVVILLALDSQEQALPPPMCCSLLTVAPGGSMLGMDQIVNDRAVMIVEGPERCGCVKPQAKGERSCLAF